MKRLYVMRSGSKYKIGVSKHPEKRLYDLSIGNPEISLIYKSDMFSNAYFIERQLHKILSNSGIGREWFSDIDEQFLLRTVKQTAEKYGETQKKQKKLGEIEEVDFAKFWNLETSFDVWIAKQKAETKKIAEENDATIDLISIVFQYPKVKDVVNGLLGLNWNCVDIRDFIKKEILEK